VLSPEKARVVAHTASRDLQFETLLIAAGAWSAQLLAYLGDRVLLESARGYNATIENAPVTLRREIIFADRKFMATPLSSGLRLGGAAEFGGLSAKPNMKRCQALLTLAGKYLPGIKGCTGSKWNGHRPATPDSLPVIGRFYRSLRVIYAFGHGHLGLTQAATTGKLVSPLVSGMAPSIDLAPFSANRFAIQLDPRLNDSPYHHDWVRRALMFEPRGHDVMWCDKPRDAKANARNAVFYGEKAIDRSPCGTGPQHEWLNWWRASASMSAKHSCMKASSARCSIAASRLRPMWGLSLAFFRVYLVGRV
jgi:hypothetical protein